MEWGEHGRMRTPSGVRGKVWKGLRVSPRGKREFKHGGVVGGVGDGVWVLRVDSFNLNVINFT